MKIPKIIDLKASGQYCINCFSKNVQRTFENELTYYKCSDCNKKLERSLVIDDSVNWWVDKDNNYWHESVGVIVVYNNKILTQLRQIYPFAYALPAGHLDKGEENEPEAAAKRELWEETGIATDSLELLKSKLDMPGDSCRRGSDHHRWHLYRLNLEQEPELKISEEASKFEWMSLDDLRRCENITYPLKFFVETIGEGLLK